MPIARPVLLLVVLAIACRADAERMPRNTEVENYLAGYSKEYQRLNHASALAEWESNTHIVAGDSSNALRTRRANEQLAHFVGSAENITRIKGYLEHRDRLTPLQARQLRPWRVVLRETTGRELDGKAMVEYFEPLYQWLRQQNRERKATLPDL
jgi:hypothetical protein